MNSSNFRDTYRRYLTNFLAKNELTATPYDRFLSLAYALRSELMKNWVETQRRYHERNYRRIYYLSTEYILGKSLFQNLLSLEAENEVMRAVESLGVQMDDLLAQEDDCMLGNGSEGRLAACLLEALATQKFPAVGYGIRYEYAQFHQEIRNGIQIERPNDWLRRGNPWEIVRPEYACTVRFGGECHRMQSGDLLGSYAWKNAEMVHAIPYDMPIVGYRNNVVNTLRLWTARASEEFLPDYLNHGDYERACDDKSKYSNITRILFPDEDVRRATDLRMKQQYFFVSASLQDIIRRFKQHNSDMDDLDKKVAIHLGGSRCSLAIPELMRILVDQEGVPWERAWEMTRAIFSYTSHAVSREDSEIWPVYKVGQILPRHLQIIFDINQIHLDKVRKKYGDDPDHLRGLSLIEEGEVKRIRFADIGVLGSSSVNGVSREQTDILRKKVFTSLALYAPERFTCKVNGVGQRRWLLTINPPLAKLITKSIGEKWIKEPESLKELEHLVEDERFLESLATMKKTAKVKLADSLKGVPGFPSEESFMYDVQLGKIHLNKRQLLHVLYILHRYLSFRKGLSAGARRVHIFAGKASPSDFLAKQIIRLIAATADCINNDPEIQRLMRVVFIPDFNMTWAENIIPAADLAEHLSTATMEPAGTFNMKFALNGAVSIASLSGANNEIAEKIATEYIFTFGKGAEDLAAMQDYRPSDILAKDERLRDIFNFLEGELVPKTPKGNALHPLLSSLRDSDRQYTLLDFDDYVKKQDLIDTLYAYPLAWAKTRCFNIARIGWFSSDRLVHEYARDVWKIDPE
ncbi:MAG: glycogen/starch/alpha-glucan family phosphorylase [Chitinispirillaceae bacterium]|nr:glycogen/starch/alpha-glucan family phosphorylase [Chitinispirillaceae bacterium]